MPVFSLSAFADSVTDWIATHPIAFLATVCVMTAGGFWLLLLNDAPDERGEMQDTEPPVQAGPVVYLQAQQRSERLQAVQTLAAQRKDDDNDRRIVHPIVEFEKERDLLKVTQRRIRTSGRGGDEAA